MKCNAKRNQIDRQENFTKTALFQWCY